MTARTTKSILGLILQPTDDIMIYEVTVIEATGFVTTKTYESKDYYPKICPLHKEAHDRAAKCLPWNQYPEEGKHLVYYYEIKYRDKIEVRIEMNPRLVDDKMFYDFVNDFKPLYVGAIHRH